MPLVAPDVRHAAHWAQIDRYIPLHVEHTILPEHEVDMGAEVSLPNCLEDDSWKCELSMSALEFI